MAKNKALPKEVAALTIRRGDEVPDDLGPDDLVVIARNAYGVQGIDTSTDKDTRKVASSPGMFTWLPQSSRVGQHPTGRKVGLKFTVILSEVQAPKDATKRESTAASGMSAVSYD